LNYFNDRFEKESSYELEYMNCCMFLNKLNDIPNFKVINLI